MRKERERVERTCDVGTLLGGAGYLPGIHLGQDMSERRDRRRNVVVGAFYTHHDSDHAMDYRIFWDNFRVYWLPARLKSRSVIDMARLNRRSLIVICTCLVGAATLAFSLRTTPGDPSFYATTFVLAAVWLAGAALVATAEQPLRGYLPHRLNMPGQALIGIGSGLALLVIFLLGAGVVAHVPIMRTPVEALLLHVHWGSTFVVTLITIVNGVTEEVFFRGALIDALPRRYTLPASIGLYTLVVAASGLPLLVLAAVCLGTLTAWLRLRTGTIFAPICVHLTWSVGMLYLLQPALNLWT